MLFTELVLCTSNRPKREAQGPYGTVSSCLCFCVCYIWVWETTRYSFESLRCADYESMLESHSNSPHLAQIKFSDFRVFTEFCHINHSNFCEVSFWPPYLPKAQIQAVSKQSKTHQTPIRAIWTIKEVFQEWTMRCIYGLQKCTTSISTKKKRVGRKFHAEFENRIENEHEQNVCVCMVN